MKKFTIKNKKSYKYSYDVDLKKLTKDFKRSLVSKETFLSFLHRTFSNVNIELFNIKDKVFYLMCNGHSKSGYRYVKLELSLFCVLCCGNCSYQLSDIVYKRATKLLNSIVNLG